MTATKQPKSRKVKPWNSKQTAKINRYQSNKTSKIKASQAITKTPMKIMFSGENSIVDTTSIVWAPVICTTAIKSKMKRNDAKSIRRSWPWPRPSEIKQQHSNQITKMKQYESKTKWDPDLDQCAQCLPCQRQSSDTIAMQSHTTTETKQPKSRNTIGTKYQKWSKMKSNRDSILTSTNASTKTSATPAITKIKQRYNKNPDLSPMARPIMIVIAQWESRSCHHHKQRKCEIKQSQDNIKQSQHIILIPYLCANSSIRI